MTHFRALLDLEPAAPGQVDLFEIGSCKLATYDAAPAQGSELVSILHKNSTVEGAAERGGRLDKETLPLL